MEQGILASTKKVLNIGPDDNTFDLDVMTHINSAFSTLNDLGVGPEGGFTIEDDTTTWEMFLPGEANQTQLSQVKSFVFLSTKLVFDPPGTSFVLDALRKQMDEIVWRLSTRREAVDWVNPEPVVIVDEEVQNG